MCIWASRSALRGEIDFFRKTVSLISCSMRTITQQIAGSSVAAAESLKNNLTKKKKKSCFLKDVMRFLFLYSEVAGM